MLLLLPLPTPRAPASASPFLAPAPAAAAGTTGRERAAWIREAHSAGKERASDPASDGEEARSRDPALLPPVSCLTLASLATGVVDRELAVTALVVVEAVCSAAPLAAVVAGREAVGEFLPSEVEAGSVPLPSFLLDPEVR